MKTILGKKIGMTQIFSETGAAIPVTVIEAGPVTVTQIKTVETDGYNAVQIGFEDKKESRSNKPEMGHFAKWGAPLKKHLVEVRLEEGETYEAGQVITVAEFEEGAKLDYIIADKNVVVTAGKELKGTDSYPVYIVKHGRV